MKVLFVTNGDDKYGGCLCLKELVLLLKQKYKVKCIILNTKCNAFNAWCDENLIENYSVRYYPWMYDKTCNWLKYIVKYIVKFFLYHIVNFAALKKIERLFDFNSIDLIHTNTSVIDIGAKLASKYDCKHIWHIREFGREDFKLYPLKMNYIKYMNNHTDAFIAISDLIRNSWIDKGILNKKIITIYDGVNAGRYGNILTNSPKTDSDVLRIVFCGAISAPKGQIRLIEAISLLSDEYKHLLKVDFIGGGKAEYINNLKKHISAKHIENNFNFRGYITNVAEFLQHYDVGVVASMCEGFGRVTVEYMLSKLLVIASNSGANVELIQDGKTGLLFDTKNNTAQALAEKIEWVINNREEAKKISLNGRKHALGKFTIEANIGKIYDFYRRTL